MTVFDKRQGAARQTATCSSVVVDAADAARRAGWANVILRVVGDSSDLDLFDGYRRLRKSDRSRRHVCDVGARHDGGISLRRVGHVSERFDAH